MAKKIWHSAALKDVRDLQTMAMFNVPQVTQLLILRSKQRASADYYPLSYLKLT